MTPLTNLYQVAARFLGTHEDPAPGKNAPLIVWWLSLCGLPQEPDETAWCSAFVNGVCFIANTARSQSAAARSWLTQGTIVPDIMLAGPGDIVVLQRGPAPQGHVGFYDHHDATSVWVLGGNQGNAVSVAKFARADVLGIRRLA